MSPYGVYEQRVFFQRFTRMQDFTTLIIIDIRHADNEFERVKQPEKKTQKTGEYNSANNRIVCN